jgi:hypothetical protein
MYLVRKVVRVSDERSLPPPPPVVYRSPRVGLELSHSETTTSPTHPRVVYVSRPYRYFVLPHLLTSNGRGHTLLGVYRSCLESKGKHDDEDAKAVLSSSLKNELSRLTGLKEATVVKYLEDYKAGLSGGSLQTFVGAAGKGAGSSPSMVLKMMGTLERVHAQSHTVHP